MNRSDDSVFGSCLQKVPADAEVLEQFALEGVHTVLRRRALAESIKGDGFDLKENKELSLSLFLSFLFVEFLLLLFYVDSLAEIYIHKGRESPPF